jgi:hypothetical protein
VSTELEVRNRVMYRQYASGKSVQDIADDHGISRQRVAQIIARYGTVGVSDDESRTLMRTQLEYLASEMISVVRKGPAPATNVKGELIYDANGEMVFDYVGVINAADTARKLSESIRRLDALDLPRRKQIIEDEAMRQARAYLAQLPQAEVVEELCCSVVCCVLPQTPHRGGGPIYPSHSLILCFIQFSRTPVPPRVLMPFGISIASLSR